MKSVALTYAGTLSIMILFSQGHDLTGSHSFRSDSSYRASSSLRDVNIQSGDIVFRLGHGFVSECMKKFSLHDPRYSHAGIISVEKGRAVVYHLLGGESSQTVMQKESLE